MNNFNVNYRFLFFCLVLNLLTSFPNLIYGQDRESSVYKSLYTNSGFLYYTGYVIEKFHDTKVVNGVRHNSYTTNTITGEGTYYYNSPVGSFRKGKFLNGELHGKGMRFLDGEYTEGNWSYGKRYGITKVWTEENYKYGAFTFEGNYVNDVIEGFGKYDCADYTYEGEYHNGQRHGKGKYIWKKSKGEYYIGSWVNGQRTGYGEMYWPDGSYYKGEFLNNNRNGDGENYSKITGINQRGQFQNDVFIEKVEANVSSSIITSQKNSNQNSNNRVIIGNPIEIGNLLVAQYDYPQNLDWDNANKACQALGDGWRLPTKDELNTLYKNRTRIGGFLETFYWSSTEHNSQQAWLQQFSNGIQYGGYGWGFKTQNILNFRAVRDLPGQQNQKINSSPSNANITSQVKSKGQVDNKPEKGANEVVKKTITQCNYQITIPVWTWKYIDNRKLCFYCRARYAIYEKSQDIDLLKKIHIVDSISGALVKHWKSINADEVHEKYDSDRRDKLLKEKGYGHIPGIMTTAFIFGGLDYLLYFSENYKFNEIKIYNIKSDFCSLKCEDEYRSRR
jgi:hypothetical protein